MASILPFGRSKKPAPAGNANVAEFLDGFSIEVMPRTAAKIADFRAILPAGTRVYIAQTDERQQQHAPARRRRMLPDN